MGVRWEVIDTADNSLIVLRSIHHLSPRALGEQWPSSHQAHVEQGPIKSVALLKSVKLLAECLWGLVVYKCKYIVAMC